MLIIQPPQLDELSPCSYLPQAEKQFRYFFAQQVTSQEISYVLARGWRKFGLYYFRPVCPQCRQCIPIRVRVDRFKPTKSQRKNLRKNQQIVVKFGPLTFQESIYEIYKDHSTNRFNQEHTLDGFLFNFYTPSCPTLQSEFYLDGKLIAAGFLDVGSDCLSSTYFVFDTAYAKRGLGIFSILKEIEQTKQMGLSYYYLGYYIASCQSMAYKNRFKPYEYYDWQKNMWCLVEE